MKKSTLKKFRPNTAEYIVAHAAFQLSRGRKPSACFTWKKNPKLALRMASRLAYFPIRNNTYLYGVDLSSYKCADCGASGVKLWRVYQTTVDCVTLRCACCAEDNQRQSHDTEWKSPFAKGEGDQIGWLVPAVPTEDCESYWGYTSVPQLACDWWDNLPVHN